MKQKGYALYMENPTNQVFVITENQTLDSLKEQLSYGFWEKYDENHTIIRIATSWATAEEDVEKLKNIL